jgi:hypothetical protein
MGALSRRVDKYINMFASTAITKAKLLSLLETKGNVWYVDASVSASGDGTTWAKAFLTITEAIAAASAWDKIMVAGGDYDEGAVLAVALQGLKIIGPGIDNQHVAMIWSSSASHHLMTINAHNVEICGLGFTQTKNTYDCIRVSTTAAYFKCHIHHCRFDGYGLGEYGVHGGTTYDTPDIVVEDNVFRSLYTASIYANGTRGIYRRNTIFVPAGSIGIEHVPNAGDRPHSHHHQNCILGVNSTDVGIKITNSPSALAYLITENKIAGCATTITSKATNDAACILNYTGDAAGGALINPSP